MEAKCRLCEIADGQYMADYDRPVYMTENFFSIASVGTMIMGWQLIVPKKHLCSMKDVLATGEADVYINGVLSVLWKTYKSVIVFEHGPNHFGSKTSCGTNHAHLHFVPNGPSLFDYMKDDRFAWEKCSPHEIASKASDKEYLFYMELQNGDLWQESTGQLCILDEPISQYFRQLIAKSIGTPDQYDYKMYPNVDLTTNSWEHLTKLFVDQ